MKIAWYTPFSVQSAIGRFSQLVCNQLLDLGIDVHVIRSETPSRQIKASETIPFDGPVVWAHQLERDLITRLQEFDLVAYNVGDHYDYHAYVFSHQRFFPGLTILHDYILHHSLNSFCHATSNQFGGYAEVVAKECGHKAVEILSRCDTTNPNDRWWQTEIARYPVFKWAMKGTLGTITHADYYEKMVRNRLGCPTMMLPLAYDQAGEATGPKPTTQVSSPKAPIVLLTVGSVNPNKRHESVIQALASSSFLAERIQYRIVGPVSDDRRRSLELLADSLPGKLDVVITGEVTREQLTQEFSQAHVIACLRHPVLEGGSASVVEGLLSGKPVLVSKAGCYAEIPKKFVHQISLENEIIDIEQALAEIVERYPQAIRRAVEARTWAAQRHDPRNYAVGFVQFAERVMYNRPVLEMVDRIAAKVMRWHSPPDSRLLSRIDTAVNEIFGDPKAAKKRNIAA